MNNSRKFAAKDFAELGEFKGLAPLDVYRSADLAHRSNRTACAAPPGIPWIAIHPMHAA